MKNLLTLLVLAASLAACTPSESDGFAPTTETKTATTETPTTAAPATTVPTTKPEPTTTAAPSEDSKELNYGVMHDRSPGFGDEGWTLSIDGVQAGELEWNNDTADSCIIVTGTATLRELNSGELTSSGFSFPEIVVIQNGLQLDASWGGCETTQLEQDGFTDAVGMELLEGATAKWFSAVYSVGTDFDLVAIESTVYIP